MRVAILVLFALVAGLLAIACGGMTERQLTLDPWRRDKTELTFRQWFFAGVVLAAGAVALAFVAGTLV